MIDEKYYLSDKMKQYIAKRGTNGYNNPDCKINKIIARPITTDPNKRAGTTNYISRDVGDEFDLNEDSVKQLRIRKLTPKECWRLMGFKDESFEKAQKVNSNTQLYKQAGNSIVVNVLEKIIANMNLELEHIRLLELFGGIGACSEAMKNLGLDFEIVDYVEIDKYAVKSYNAINGTNFEPQDICEWDKDIKVDLLCGGFPCQDISLAGQQKGIIKGKTRSGLMYEMMRIIEKIKPKYIITENVKNLLSEKFRPQLEEYLCFLHNNGYNVTMDCLNSKDFSIPQNRERVFIIGVKQNGE